MIRQCMPHRARIRRIVPPGTGEWIEIEIELQSENGRSLMVTAPEGLNTGGSISLLGHKMVLALLRDERGALFTDIMSGSRWELERPQ